MQVTADKKRVCIVCGSSFVVTLYNRASKTCGIQCSKANEMKRVANHKYGRRGDVRAEKILKGVLK